MAASGRLVLETHISFVISPSDVELPRGVVAVLLYLMCCPFSDVCMYACMHGYVCKYVGICVCMYVCMYVYMYLCIYVRMYACMDAWMRFS